MKNSETLGFVLAASVAMLGGTLSAAHAAWTEEQWNSGYNIVVRVGSDTIAGTVDVWAQNNTGMPLPNFGLLVEDGTATRKTVTRDDHGFLMPGENSHFVVTTKVTKASDLKLKTKFGWHAEAEAYGTGSFVVIQDSTCAITPSTDPAQDFAKGTAVENCLRRTAEVDFGPDEVAAMGEVLDAYCAGRATWNVGSATPSAKDCRSVSYDTCPAAPTATTAAQMEFDGLWQAAQIAIRKAAIRTEWLPKLRSRLQCAAQDPMDTFSTVALFVLGYLGEDAKARAFLEAMTSDAKRGVVAKAALLLMGKADDLTKYGADVRAGMAGSSAASAACMAAMTIVAKEDAAAAKLINLAYWTDPTSDPAPFVASHFLAIAAWEQKHWGPKAKEGVAVTFYKDDQKAWSCTKPYAGPTAGPDGGATASDGGIGATDGANDSATQAATGGAGGAAGSTSSGGSAGSGSGSGGKSGSGGALGSGGSSGSGGQTGGGTTQSAPGDSGCGCSLATAHSAVPWAALFAVAFVVFRRRKKVL
jgi:MYXO-CTERM domain-containing protein